MDILDFIIKPYAEYSTVQVYLEVVAASLGITSVICSARKSIWVYPTGIVSTAIYVYLLFCWGLYGDMFINAYYFTMSIYGWYLWAKIDESNEHMPITNMNLKEKKQGILIFCASIIFILFLYHFKPYIESGFDSEVLMNLPAPFYWITEDNISFNTKIQYVDTITTALFFVGMWAMAKKKIENWFFWILGDIISVPMYIAKGYGITSFQYFIFLIPAFLGYIYWRRDLMKQKANNK